MGKRKICKIVFVILSIFLCVAFYELFGICIAYKKQPEVSNTIKKETHTIQWKTQFNLNKVCFFIHAKSSLYNRLLDIAKTAFQKQLTSKSTVF